MHLVVVLDDQISEWEKKGEVLAGYFNPAGIFQRITVLSLVPDRPEPETVDLLTAPAKGEFVAMGGSRTALALRTLGLRQWLLQRVLCRFLAQSMPRPDIVRAYGDGLAAIAGGLAARMYGVPYIVSLHATPDSQIRRRYSTMKDRVWRWLLAAQLQKGLSGASRIIAVYSPILPWLPPEVRKNAVVIPNIVGVEDRHPERPGRAAAGLRLLWVGRLIPGRDPAPIVEALSLRPHDHLTIIGDGPLAPGVRRQAEASGVSARITMIASMPNAELVKKLRDFDALVLRTDYQELAKPVMEAGLAGLPVIINREPSAGLDEYRDFPAIFTEATAQSYAAALATLSDSPEQRARIGSQTSRAAWRRWDPALVAARLATVMCEAVRANDGSGGVT